MYDICIATYIYMYQIYFYTSVGFVGTQQRICYLNNV
jgi:hypothetical protein